MTKKDEAGIEQRFARISAASGLATALSIGFQLVSVPVCLRFWGSGTYGTWLALFAAFTLIRTLDGGYIGYVGNKLNMLYHRDEQELRSTMASAAWGVATLGVIQLGILALLSATGSIGIILEGQHNVEESRELTLALFILCGSWILTGSYFGIVHRFLIPAGMMYQAAWWSMAFQVAQFAALILAAVGRLTILQAALLFAAVQAAVYVTSAVYIRFKLPAFYPWWKGTIPRAGLVDLLRSFPLTVAGLLQQAGNSGLVVLVSAVLGPATVPIFTTIRTLGNLWTMMISVLTSPLLPDVVRFQAKKEAKKLLAVQEAHWALVGSAINLTIMIAYPFLESVYQLWTRSLLPLDRSLLCLTIATVSLSGMSALMGMFLAGINHSPFIWTSAIFRGAVSLLLAAFLIPVYGLAGLGMAVLTSEAMVLAITMFWLFRAELAGIGETPAAPTGGWAWLSTGSVVAFLVLESLGISELGATYWIAMAGAITGAVLAWVGLDAEIKGRVHSVVESTLGFLMRR